jgi:hypothetical protein
MKKLILPLALITALFSPISKAADYGVYGYGMVSCGAWTAERKNDAIKTEVYQAWIMGFVSGFGFSQVAELKTTDHKALSAHIDNYCAANPLDDVADAAAALIYELME